MNLTQQLYAWFPPIAESQLLQSLPALSHLIIEIILWVFAVGAVALALSLAMQSWRLAWLSAVIPTRLAKAELAAAPLPARVKRLRNICWPIGALRWAVGRLALLSASAGTRHCDDVIDLAATAYDDKGVLPQLPKIAILLGLLGTLIGLTQSVASVFIEVETLENIESLREPLRETLTGLGAAFVTTLAGVLVALLLTPGIVLCKLMRSWAARSLDAILSTQIFPLFARAQDDIEARAQAAAERIAEAVVGDRLQTVVRDTSAGLNRLAESLLYAVQSTSAQSADAVILVDRLDAAAAALARSGERTEQLLGRVDTAIAVLSNQRNTDAPSASTVHSEDRIAETIREFANPAQLQMTRLQETIDTRAGEFRNAIEMATTSMGNGLSTLRRDLEPLHHLAAETQKLTARLERDTARTDRIAEQSAEMQTAFRDWGSAALTGIETIAGRLNGNGSHDGIEKMAEGLLEQQKQILSLLDLFDRIGKAQPMLSPFLPIPPQANTAENHPGESANTDRRKTSMRDDRTPDQIRALYDALTEFAELHRNEIQQYRRDAEARMKYFEAYMKSLQVEIREARKPWFIRWTSRAAARIRSR